MSGSWGLFFIQRSRQRKNPLPLCDMRGSRLHSPLLGLGRYLCRPSRRLSLIPYLLDTAETRVFEQLQAYSGFSSLLFRYAPPLEIQRINSISSPADRCSCFGRWTPTPLFVALSNWAHHAPQGWNMTKRSAITSRYKGEERAPSG